MQVKKSVIEHNSALIHRILVIQMLKYSRDEVLEITNLFCSFSFR